MDPWIVEKNEVIVDKGVVSSAHQLASQAGLEILMNGGNAVDAGAATSFAIGVVEPFMSSIGGGGAINIHLASEENIVIDGYVAAPKKIRDFDWSSAGYKNPCVPGIVAAWTLALDRYGTMSLKEVTKPAIRYARNGFYVDSYIERFVLNKIGCMNGAGVRLVSKFLHSPYRDGDIFHNKDLAKCLELIGKEGSDAFYKGRIARMIVEDMENNGGLITMEDLADYEARVYVPVTTTYRDHKLHLVPYAHGGVTVGHILNILDMFDQGDLAFNTVGYYHILAEAQKRAFADRLSLYGDPFFVLVPWEGILSKEYANELFNHIDRKKSSGVVGHGDPWIFDGTVMKPDENLRSSYSGVSTVSGETTSFSIVDKDRNMVAANQSIGNPFGSGICVPGGGFFLNDWMFKATGSSGFWPDPRHPSHLAPGKRPVNNHAPTIVYRDGQPLMALGSPAGRRQQGAIVQTIIHVIDHNMGLQEAISAPRAHCEGNTLWMESKIPNEIRKTLSGMGHEVVDMPDITMFFGGLNAVMVNQETGRLHGGADIRRPCAAVGY